MQFRPAKHFSFQKECARNARKKNQRPICSCVLAGLQTLLDFLGSSFRGGTDVVTPLRWAVGLLRDGKPPEKFGPPKMPGKYTTNANAAGKPSKKGAEKPAGLEEAAGQGGGTGGLAGRRGRPGLGRRGGGIGLGGGGGGVGWGDADLLLVTDGELRMPPADPNTLASLQEVK